MDNKNNLNPIYNRLEKLCTSNNIKITQLCVQITGNKGNLATWKKGNIRNDYLVNIGNKFGVNADYLLCKTDNPAPIKNINFDEDFFYDLNSVKSLTPEQRKQLNEAMRIFIDSPPEQKKSILDFAKFINSGDNN